MTERGAGRSSHGSALFSTFLRPFLIYRLCEHSTWCILQRKTVFSQNGKQILLGGVLAFLVSVKLYFVNRSGRNTSTDHSVISSLQTGSQKRKCGLISGKELGLKTFLFFLVWQKLTGFGFVAALKPGTAPELSCFRVICAGCGCRKRHRQFLVEWKNQQRECLFVMPRFYIH